MTGGRPGVVPTTGESDAAAGGGLLFSKNLFLRNAVTCPRRHERRAKMLEPVIAAAGQEIRAGCAAWRALLVAWYFGTR